jgi:penicillin-binding protein 2
MPEPSIVFTDVNERQGTFNRRTFIMGGVVAFGLFALTGRLVHLQMLQGGKYQKLAASNQFNFRLIPPPRGQIVDRNGKLIAGNRPSFRVLIQPSDVKDVDDTLDQISYVLPETQTSRRRILRDINENQRSVPTIVAADLSWEDFSKVELYANEIPGVVADMNQMRAYYYGGAFSHVVGYVSKASEKDLAHEDTADDSSFATKLLHDPSFRIGKQGIEKAYDKQLRGSPGGRRVEVNSTGVVVREDPDGSIAPTPGQEIVLTLDADIQQRAVDVFAKDSGGAVMMNIETGEVLCMVSCPGFDPNLFVSGIPSADYKLLHDYDHNPLLDKALSATFPPGSTFKTMVALAALENGYDPKTVHVCGKTWAWGGRVWHCDEAHGPLDLHEAIVTSCDIYFYQCALAVGPDKIANVARHFGLGDKFDIGINGQHPGLVPDTAWKRKTYPKDPVWHPGETPSMGIGQGYTNLNALQLCVQASRLANGRKAVLPHLVKSIGGVDQIANEKFDDLPFNPANMDFVKAAMQAVVTDPRGTAAGAAKLGLGSVAMAGKTGTAQPHGYAGGIGQHGSTGAWAGRDHAWFIAFAPADAPKYACSVIVEHGGFGAHSAAPIAREIMRVALLKDPDIRKRIVGPIEDTKDFSDTAVTTDPDAAAAQDTSVTAPPPNADSTASDGDDTSE